MKLKLKKLYKFLRNLGSVLSYSLISYNSTIKGLTKIDINKEIIRTDLHNNLAVLSEGIQTILRKHRIPNSYELLHNLTRGNNVTQEDLHNFIEEMPENIQEDVKRVTIESYIGLSNNIV